MQDVAVQTTHAEPTQALSNGDDPAALLRTPRGEVEGPVGAVCANCGAPNAAIAGGELDPDEAVCSAECYEQLMELGCPQEHGGTYRPKPARRGEEQGQERWEDMVFGPIVEAYNEAHDARRSEGGSNGLE